MNIRRWISMFFLCAMCLGLLGTRSLSIPLFRNIGHVILTQTYFDTNASFSRLRSRFIVAQHYFELAQRNGCSSVCDQDINSSTLSADNLLHVGRYFDSINALPQMFQWYKFAIESGNNVSDGLYYYGYALNWRSLSSVRDPEKALDTLLAALAQDDFSSTGVKAETFYRIASLYCNYMNRSPEVCIPYYEQAVATDPVHAFAWMELGRQHFHQWADLSKAEALLQKAIAVSTPFEAKWAYFHLGEIYREAGHSELARRQYEMALRIDRDFLQATVALQGLD